MFSATSGCLQGGYLSGTLFLMFINDIHSCLDDSSIKVSIFVDDVKFYRIINNVSNCIDLQAAMNRILLWCKSHDMMLNANKYNALSFSRSKNILKYEYAYDESFLKRVKCVRDLGIYFDGGLTFHEHKNITCSKALKVLGFIKRNSNFFDSKTVLILCTSLVRPILEYNTLVWNPHLTCQNNKIENVQRKFVRYMCVLK